MLPCPTHTDTHTHLFTLLSFFRSVATAHTKPTLLTCSASAHHIALRVRCNRRSTFFPPRPPPPNLVYPPAKTRLLQRFAVDVVAKPYTFVVDILKCIYCACVGIRKIGEVVKQHPQFAACWPARTARMYQKLG